MKLKYETLRSATEKMDQTNESRLKELKTQLKQSQGDRDKLTKELNCMIKIKSSNSNEASTTSAAVLTSQMSE